MTVSKDKSVWEGVFLVPEEGSRPVVYVVQDDDEVFGVFHRVEDADAECRRLNAARKWYSVRCEVAPVRLPECGLDSYALARRWVKLARMEARKAALAAFLANA